MRVSLASLCVAPRTNSAAAIGRYGPQTHPGGVRAALHLAAAPILALLSGCSDLLPFLEDDDLIRSGYVIEVTFPFDDFATGARVYGGYGLASQLSGGFLAHEFGAQDDEGDPQETGLSARTLSRFPNYPRLAQVLDTLGVIQIDSSLTFVSGQVLTRIDTVASVHDGPVEIVAHALSEPWDAPSATWEYAVDTIGHRTPWTTPGGGAARRIGSATWDPEEGDSVGFFVDSAQIAEWGDTTDIGRGLRLSTTTPGVRLRVSSSLLRLDTRPSVNPDTLIELASPAQINTFIYAPTPSQPRKTLRVGGAPAWRSVLHLDLPTELHGPPELCEALDCPVELGEEHVSFAALRLITRVGPRAFAPSDTVPLDLRSVLAPEVLPKSPLGNSRIGAHRVPHELFAAPAGEVVELPVTTLVRDLLRGETVLGAPISSSAAILTTAEPYSIDHLTFEGVESPLAPSLRVVLIFARGGR